MAAAPACQSPLPPYRDWARVEQLMRHTPGLPAARPPTAAIPAAADSSNQRKTWFVLAPGEIDIMLKIGRDTSVRNGYGRLIHTNTALFSTAVSDYSVRNPAAYPANYLVLSASCLHLARNGYLVGTARLLEIVGRWQTELQVPVPPALRTAIARRTPKATFEVAGEGSFDVKNDSMRQAVYWSPEIPVTGEEKVVVEPLK